MLDNLARINREEDDSGDTPSIVATKESNAERQRRYRARKRNGTVTRRNADVTHDSDHATATGETIVVVPEQAQVSLYFNNDGGLVLRQTCWPDDDACIVIARDSIVRFIDALTDAVGIPSLP